MRFGFEESGTLTNRSGVGQPAPITMADENLTDEENEANDDFAKRYPEHTKFDKVRAEAQAIGQFIETGGWLLCKWPDGASHPIPTNFSINQVLADYFKIDLKVLEDEKQAMLKALANPGG